MDTWESFFRDQSKRRWSRHSREKLVRRAILVLFAGSVAVAAVMLLAGFPG